MDVLSVSDGDNLDLDSSLSDVNDGDNLVGLLVLVRRVEANLAPLSDETGSVSDEDGGRLVDDLEDVDAGVSGCLGERVSLLGVERGRGGDDTSVVGRGSEEVGGRLEERLEEQGRHLGDREHELLRGRLSGGGRVGARRGRRRLGRLLASGSRLGRRGRSGHEDVDLVAGQVGAGHGDDGGRGGERGRGGGRDILEPEPRKRERREVGKLKWHMIARAQSQAGRSTDGARDGPVELIDGEGNEGG